jgi:hypothetical protein
MSAANDRVSAFHSYCNDGTSRCGGNDWMSTQLALKSMPVMGRIPNVPVWGGHNAPLPGVMGH